MANLNPELNVERCPFCSVAKPRVFQVWQHTTTNHAGRGKRVWYVYQCATCGGLVTAAGPSAGGPVTETYPSRLEADDALPPLARDYMNQAIKSFAAPAGAVMLAASS